MHKKRRAYAAVILLSFIAFSAAADGNIRFTFSPASGVCTGKVEEYVFEGDKTISRLDWQQYAVPMIAASGSLSIYNAFFKATVLSALPIQCGIMEDYDFLNSDPAVISQYSHHDVYLDKRFDLSAETGYQFSISKFSITPGTGITYRNHKWSARDGYLQYPVGGAWTGNEEKEQVSGNSISYEQADILPFISLKAGYEITPVWEIMLTGSVYPYMIIYTLDSHYLRNKQFYDSMKGGFGFTAGGSIRYKSISLNITYEYLSAMNGTTASGIIGITDSGLTVDSRYGAGTDSSLWTVWAAYTF
jgi:hypothetical protein